MNYLAHGYRFLDRPLYVAGTAVPDWLSVADRRTRVRTRLILAAIPGLSGDEQTLAEGMLQHLEDDDRFHRSPVFMMLESEIGARFRTIMTDPFDHRPGFLGHILTELLLDAVIAERQPEILRHYYQALQDVCPLSIQRTVNCVSARPTERLAGFVAQFREVEFLYDYLDDERLLHRLNQVLRRVKLQPVDEQAIPFVRDSRSLLRRYGEDLLQPVELRYEAVSAGVSCSD
jgi:hypothetical protein